MINAKWARSILNFNIKRHYKQILNEIELRIAEATGKRLNSVSMVIPFEERERIEIELTKAGYMQDWIDHTTWLEVEIRW